MGAQEYCQLLIILKIYSYRNFWIMIIDIFKFYKLVKELLECHSANYLTLGGF